MQTTQTPRTTSRAAGAHAAGRRDGARGRAGRRSRWRRDLSSARSAMPRRIGLILGACVVSLLATAATGLADYWRSFAQNTAADLIGAIVAMYVLIPLAQHPGQDEDPHGEPESPSADETTAATVPAQRDTPPTASADAPSEAAPGAVESPVETPVDAAA